MNPIFATRLTQTSFRRWPVRLSARTAPFHGAKTGSTPVPATKPSRAIGKAFLMHPIVKVNEQSELAIPQRLKRIYRNATLKLTNYFVLLIKYLPLA